MASLIEHLIREHGDEVAERISSRLGISREEAEKALPAAASVVFERFDPGDSERGENGPGSLEQVLGGAGEQVSERVASRIGVSPDQAAMVVPLVLPVILRFLVRRVPYGGAALALLTKTVESQGYGSLDEIAVLLVRRFLPQADPSGKPPPSVATRLGRLAGKYFPSDDS